MDNLTLDNGQLYPLIAFINKRGFHEPLMIVEILDHFACKVEEKMNQAPGISLEAAMAAAHDDFWRPAAVLQLQRRSERQMTVSPTMTRRPMSITCSPNSTASFPT